MKKEKEEKLKKEAQKFLGKEGNTRGEVYVLKGYIEKNYSKESLHKVEKKISEILGREFEFADKRPSEWFPEYEEIVKILVAKYVLDWDKDELFEVGRYVSVNSFNIRTLLRYFVSIEKLVEKAPDYWDKYFDFGELEVVGFDKQEKQFKVRLKDFDFHPVVCPYLAGYFYALVETTLDSDDVSIKEVKCTHEGDDYHEYLIQW